jgi:regulatory protein
MPVRRASRPPSRQVPSRTTAGSAVEWGLTLLAARSWTEARLRERLATRYGDDEVESALVRLRELGLIDDRAWAERHVAEQLRRGRGRHRIRAELLRRGVDEATAEAALVAIVDDEVEREGAVTVLAALARHRDEEAVGFSRADRSRLFRRMVARGYPASLVRDLLGVS